MLAARLTLWRTFNDGSVFDSVSFMASSERLFELASDSEWVYLTACATDTAGSYRFVAIGCLIVVATAILSAGNLSRSFTPLRQVLIRSSFLSLAVKQPLPALLLLITHLLLLLTQVRWQNFILILRKLTMVLGQRRSILCLLVLLSVATRIRRLVRYWVR